MHGEKRMQRAGTDDPAALARREEELRARQEAHRQARDEFASLGAARWEVARAKAGYRRVARELR